MGNNDGYGIHGKARESGTVPTSPRVYLALDNCFAKKRWCAPEEWVPLIRDLGVRYVEASADNEIDPFFSLPEVVADWRDSVVSCCEKYDMRISTCYSGHGTYSTLGLGHYDPRIRAHLREDWFSPMIDLAASFDACLGFFAHAFDERTLRDPLRYAEAYDTLSDDIGVLSRYAAEKGLRGFGVEQMYSPNQPPWTLNGTEDFLRRANSAGGTPVYITIDTGHQSGQHLFQKPTPDALAAFHTAVKEGKQAFLYLGCREHEAEFRKAVLKGMSPAELELSVAEFADGHDYLFACADDGNLYKWLERFARSSPIIHLQQTDGKSSSHHCFTQPLNAAGIVDPKRVLESMAASYSGAGFPGEPPPPREVFLVLEPFLPTACWSGVYLDDIAESVAFWRRFIPEDGLTLCDLVGKNRKEKQAC